MPSGCRCKKQMMQTYIFKREETNALSAGGAEQLEAKLTPPLGLGLSQRN